MPHDKWTKLGLTKAKLQALYDQHTVPEIAQQLGVAEMTVQRWMRRHGIDGIHEAQRRDSNRTGLKFEDLTKEILQSLYCDKLLSDKEIGALVDRSKFPIRMKREEWGIETIDKSMRAQLKAARQAPKSVLTSGQAPGQAPGLASGQAPPVAAPLVSKAVKKPGSQQSCGWSGCGKGFWSVNGAKYCSPTCGKAVGAERARKNRLKNRKEGPVVRTFTCETEGCGTVWKTEQPGVWRFCPRCQVTREQAARDEERVRRTKVCAYEDCGLEFEDESTKNGQKFCSTECRRRSKVIRRNGPVEFLAEQVRQCECCGAEYTPTRGNQKFCGPACYVVNQPLERDKTCKHCGKDFVDTSPNNNMRAHPECSRLKWGHKLNTKQKIDDSPNTQASRRLRVLHGDGGRIDDFSTLIKYTMTWWGRLGELIFQMYRPKAKDMNIEHGNRSPYDFEDPELGRVDVRTTTGRKSPEGRIMWAFSVSGLKQSCDHAFLVGLSEDQLKVEHLWLVPVKDLESHVMRMAPGSSSYRGDTWDVSSSWGLMMANTKLTESRALPEPERTDDRFAWMDDEANLNDSAPGHRGRKSELLYKGRYPTSEDMNRKHGSTYPFDFLDADGTKVNVKSSRRALKQGSATSYKWAFSRGAPDVRLGHRCDIYSCLCLSEDGVTILREYRIPAAAWADKRTIHIYESGSQWDEYLVG